MNHSAKKTLFSGGLGVYHLREVVADKIRIAGCRLHAYCAYRDKFHLQSTLRMRYRGFSGNHIAGVDADCLGIAGFRWSSGGVEQIQTCAQRLFEKSCP